MDNNTDNNLVIKLRENRGNYWQDGKVWLEKFSDDKIVELDQILSSVECIGGSAFTNSNIKEIVIPDNIKKIGYRAFSFCRNLKNIGLNSNIETIPCGCFSNCYSLEKVVIPEGVKSICEEAFSECWGLKDVVLPSTLVRIADRAFWGTQISTLNIPKGCVVNNHVLKSGTINYYEANDDKLNDISPRTRIIDRMIRDYNYKLYLDRNTTTMHPKKMDEYEENMRFLKTLLNGEEMENQQKI